MIRFYNGRLLRFQPQLRITEEELWVDGSTIKYIGAKPDIMPSFEREIDLNGDLLMPGFKNMHTHTAMTFLRSLADEKELHAWLNEDIFPREAKLTDESLYYLTKLGIMEYLSSGITFSFDMYYRNDTYARANIECGFRTAICSALNDYDADITNIEREYLKFNSLHELVSYKLGIHAEYTTSMDRLEYLASLVEKYKAPAYTHISETAQEVQGCIDRYGLTPPQLLDRLGFFKYGGGGFHCVHFTDEDIQLFADKNLLAVTCPASNLKLASGIAPLDKYRRAGMKLAIGTDGSSSNNALDFFREMYLASVLQKYLEGSAAAGPAEEILKMACVNGMDALGMEDCDDIAEGKKADLTVINLHRPNMQPINNIINNIVYSGSKENIRLTMVNGRILYENGEFFIGEDPERIYAKAQKFIDGIR